MGTLGHKLAICGRRTVLKQGVCQGRAHPRAHGGPLNPKGTIPRDDEHDEVTKDEGHARRYCDCREGQYCTEIGDERGAQLCVGDVSAPTSNSGQEMMLTVSTPRLPASSIGRS